MTTYRTAVADAVLHASGRAQLPSGVWLSCIPLVARDRDRLLAHCSYADAVQAARGMGGELIHYEVVEELADFAQARGLELVPVTLPDAELRARVTRKTGESDHDYNVRLYAPMASLEWCERADGRIFDQLAARGWDGKTPVANAGKHHQHGAPPGRCYIRGWRVPEASGGFRWIQAGVRTPSTAMGPHSDGQFDYATTTMVQWSSGKVVSIPAASGAAAPAVLRRGSRGEAVKRWQQVVGALQDGVFGPNTERATREWQLARGLTPSGVVGADEWALVVAVEVQPPTPPEGPTEGARLVDSFLQAKNFHKGRRGGKILHIVIHDMEAAETSRTAENVARWFANQPAAGATVNGRKWGGSSCHYNVDCDSIVQSVRDEDTAWHAPGANHTGIGIEHAGYAKQTREEWLDDFGVAMLRRSAKLIAHLCAKYNIPIEHISVADLAAGKPGIVSHWDCTRAFRTRGGHVDPGPNFPWDQLLEWVREYS